MKIKLLTIFVIINVSLLNAQQKEMRNDFVNYLLNEMNENGKQDVFLSSSKLNTIFPISGSEKEVYERLGEYFSISEVDSLDNYVNWNCKDSKWEKQDFEIDVENEEILRKGLDNNLMVVEKGTKRKVNNCLTNVGYVQISHPIFFAKSKCLVLLTSVAKVNSSNTCLLIYSLDDSGNWGLSETVICYYG